MASNGLIRIAVPRPSSHERSQPRTPTPGVPTDSANHPPCPADAFNGTSRCVAINDAMAQLEAYYPDPIPSAQGEPRCHCLDDAALLAPTSPRLTLMRPRKRGVTKVSRKGAAIPDPRGQHATKSLDVIEYATDLLMEESGPTEYEIPSADQRLPSSWRRPSKAPDLHRQTFLSDPARVPAQFLAGQPPAQ